MTTQMYYMKTRNEFNENQIMEYEQKQTRHYLCNVEIRSLLEDKEAELEEIKNNMNKELECYMGEISILKCRLACMSINLVRKDEECNKLKLELGYTNKEENMDIDMDNCITSLSQVDINSA